MSRLSLTGVPPVVAAAVLAVADLGAAQEQLDPLIPAADPGIFLQIEDMTEWGNPTLMFMSDGIRVWALGLPENGVKVSPEDLAQTLIALPVEAWPLGRAMGGSGPSIFPTHPDPERNRQTREAIDRHRAEAEVVLERLGVIFERWPA